MYCVEVTLLLLCPTVLFIKPSVQIVPPVLPPSSTRSSLPVVDLRTGSSLLAPGGHARGGGGDD